MNANDRLPDLKDSPADDAAQALDRQLHAAQARLAGGLSPISLGLAFADWAWHLAAAPGVAARLTAAAQTAALDAAAGAPTDGNGAADPRFAGPGWNRWPYDAMARLHLGAQHWWREATDLRGMEPHHRDVVHLFARQWLDMVSPSNWPWSNPQVLRKTFDTQGDNLARGAARALDDWRRAQGLPPPG